MSALANAPTLTPPSSSHGTETPWNLSSGAMEKSSPTKSYRNGQHANGRQTDASHTGNVDGGDTVPRKQSLETSLLSPPYQNKPRSIKETNSPADSLLDLYASDKLEPAGDAHKRSATEAHSSDSPVEDKWIHRDKLARIESEELQAAGIILPRTSRSRSKSQTRARREQSQDKPNGRTRAPTGGTDQQGARFGKNSEVEPRTPDLSAVPSWDLRLPEEIARDGEGYFVPNGVSGKGSKIPVAKTSPVPIPVEHIERDTPMIRKRDGSPGEEDSITYPKTRTRSGSLGNSINGTTLPVPKRAATDTSPKKTASGARKASGPGKPANGAGRPRTRGGPSKDSSSSGAATRPTTRSGELSPSNNNKQPEGEPPWMISAYRPDPRLPPDQQLLPTVARRLQQEKWEKEGKFGNIYDREFRPLTDEGFLKPPEPTERNAPEEEPKNEKPEEWPFKAEPPKSPGLSVGRTGSYSTMPKINDPPLSPMPSPRHAPGQQSKAPSIIRVPDAPETTKKEKGGCGCCIVM
ncbi:hypothetical protein GE09DRAFT_1215755 [Coniochaeta sp. 2T2.1]|nr:hypothetical protein GE09DRAFT_1215755 [Coniochaeta sp. 2T2.1]